MNLFDTSKLSPMQAARLETALAKRLRYSDGVRTLGEDLQRRFDAGQLVAKKASDGAIDYDRRKFNRMTGKEQSAYEARLAAKRYYWAEDSDGIGHAIPKTIFDVLTLPLAASSL